MPDLSRALAMLVSPESADVGTLRGRRKAPDFEHVPGVPAVPVQGRGMACAAGERPAPPCPSDVTERSAILMESAGLERSEADAAALREVGFDTWEAHACAQREFADAERDRPRRGHPGRDNDGPGGQFFTSCAPGEAAAEN
jgi:hypothetical protein